MATSTMLRGLQVEPTPEILRGVQVEPGLLIARAPSRAHTRIRKYTHNHLDREERGERSMPPPRPTMND